MDSDQVSRSVSMERAELVAEPTPMQPASVESAPVGISLPVVDCAFHIEGATPFESVSVKEPKFKDIPCCSNHH